MYPGLAKQGLRYISVNYGDDKKTIDKYVKEGKFTFPIGMNGSGTNDVAKVFGVMAYPTNYLLDANGKVVARFVGFDEESMKAALRKMGFKI
jgi:thioredoxin-like negative regulator of GroEL